MVIIIMACNDNEKLRSCNDNKKWCSCHDNEKLCNCNNNEKIVVVLIKLLLHITCYMTVFIYGVSQYATGL